MEEFQNLTDIQLGINVAAGGLVVQYSSVLQWASVNDNNIEPYTVYPDEKQVVRLTDIDPNSAYIYTLNDNNNTLYISEPGTFKISWSIYGNQSSHNWYSTLQTSTNSLTWTDANFGNILRVETPTFLRLVVQVNSYVTLPMSIDPTRTAFYIHNLGGEKGSTGETGIDGLSVAGPSGRQGMQGPTGLQGPTGAIGEKGFIGGVGLQGIRGPSGPVGPKGSIGPLGPTGHIGQRGSIKYTIGLWDNNLIINNTDASRILQVSRGVLYEFSLDTPVVVETEDGLDYTQTLLYKTRFTGRQYFFDGITYYYDTESQNKTNGDLLLYIPTWDTTIDASADFGSPSLYVGFNKAAENNAGNAVGSWVESASMGGGVITSDDSFRVSNLSFNFQKNSTLIVWIKYDGPGSANILNFGNVGTLVWDKNSATLVVSLLEGSVSLVSDQLDLLDRWHMVALLYLSDRIVMIVDDNEPNVIFRENIPDISNMYM
jgi:hypothetical protein